MCHQFTSTKNLCIYLCFICKIRLIKKRPLPPKYTFKRKTGVLLQNELCCLLSALLPAFYPNSPS